MTGEKKLTGQQNSAALALATGSTQAKAAKQAGVTDRTIRRWLALPAFTTAIRDFEADQLRQLHRRLTGLAWDALDVLEAEMHNSDGTAGTRTRAALGIMQYRKEFYEAVAMQDTLTDIEQRLQEAGL